MILIGLPVDLDGDNHFNLGSALVLHARGGGLSVQTLNDTHFRSRVNFKLSFPKGTEFETFRVETEIVWRDVYFWEDWKGYQYASKSVERLNGHYLKLKRLLWRFFRMAETPPEIRRSGDSA